MSISAISSLTSPGTQYNFSNMTAKQEIAAAANLTNEGEITGQQFAILAGEAVSFSPSSPIVVGGSNDPLASAKGQNYVQMLQEEIGDLKSVGTMDPAEQNTLSAETNLLQELNSYGMTGNTQSTGSLVSQGA